MFGLEEVGSRTITQEELAWLRILKQRVRKTEQDLLVRALEGETVEAGVLELEIRTHIAGGRCVKQLIVR